MKIDLNKIEKLVKEELESQKIAGMDIKTCGVYWDDKDGCKETILYSSYLQQNCKKHFKRIRIKCNSFSHGKHTNNLIIDKYGNFTCTNCNEYNIRKMLIENELFKQWEKEKQNEN